MLEGKFNLDSLARAAIFYLEGPPNGVDLLVSTVVIKRPNPPQCQGSSAMKQVRTLDERFERERGESEHDNRLIG